MPGFRIKEISALGKDVPKSSIDFKSGANIIYGPSNTGKSVVVKCIRFMFGGSTIPEIAFASEYDTISMILLDDADNEIAIFRKILQGNDRLKGASTVNIVSQSPIVESGKYYISHKPNKSYNDVLLKLLGIEERIELIANKSRTPNALTVKSFAHQFLLDKSSVTSEKSIIVKPGERNYNDTANINALMFLLTGEYEDPTEVDNTQTKIAKKKAVITYITNVRIALEQRQGELNEELANFEDFNADRLIDEILIEISEIEGKIANASNEGRVIASELQTLIGQKQEASLLKERFIHLKSLYESDINRLKFIVEGEGKIESYKAETCPFCESELSTPPKDPHYREAAKAELEATRNRIYGVYDAEMDVDEDIQNLSSQIQELESKRTNVLNLIQQAYQPKLAELKGILKSSERVTQLKQEIASREEILKNLEDDLGDTETLYAKVDEYNAKAFFDRKLFNALSNDVEDAIRECNYPDFASARISDATFDVVVNGKPKSMEGEGFQAYLNSIFAFTLMDFLSSNGKYPIGLLLLEAPILSLKEKEDRVDKPASGTMKNALFRYMLDNCGSRQLIIVENEIPEGIDYDSVNLIEFTRSKEHGRYGFLARTRDFKNDERAELMWQSVGNEEEEEDGTED